MNKLLISNRSGLKAEFQPKERRRYVGVGAEPEALALPLEV